MKKCRICNGELAAFLEFGKMTLANAFLRPDKLSGEFFFDLTACFCSSCCMVQLLDQPPREKMFHSEYPFFTGSSKKMTEHFRDFAQSVRSRYLSSGDPLVVEIGSNDGTFLSNFKSWGIRHIGFEPAENPALAAETKGIRIFRGFFEADTARRVLAEAGKADVIIAANVLCHIPDLHSVLESVKILLKPGGVFVFEEPYWGDVLSKVAYDQIYDEHVFLFSVLSIRALFERHDMEIVCLEPQATHGGSMRFVAALRGDHPVDPGVNRQIEIEMARGLDRTDAYRDFSLKCEASRKRLRDILLSLKKDGKRVMGYGATSKSTTVTNYCGITPELIHSICDTTPVKQNRLSPGAHIPIVPYEDFETTLPDYAVLFAWNHSREIFEKESGFTRRGGKWIIFVPEVKILGREDIYDSVSSVIS